MNPTDKKLRIGIAVVEHGGRFAVGVRSLDGSQPGKSEFPGGKLEPNETPVACVVRECWEETGLTVEPYSELAIIRTERLELHFWRCRVPDQAPQSEPPLTEPFRWVTRDELNELDFPLANTTVIAQLAPE